MPSRFEVCRDLFGEFPSRIIVTTKAAELLWGKAKQWGLAANIVGKVGGERLIMEYEGVKAIDTPIERLEAVWNASLPHLLDKRRSFG